MPEKRSASKARWSKNERLIVAAAIAPVLRAMPAEKGNRRVAVVDKSGKVVGYRTLKEIQAKLLEAERIAIEVSDGVRPKEAPCCGCGVPVKLVVKGGKGPRAVCPRCQLCVCGVKLGRSAYAPARVRQRGGRRPMCRTCQVKSPPVRAFLHAHVARKGRAPKLGRYKGVRLRASGSKPYGAVARHIRKHIYSEGFACARDAARAYNDMVADIPGTYLNDVVSSCNYACCAKEKKAIV